MKKTKKTRQQERLEEIAEQVKYDLGYIDWAEVNKRYNAQNKRSN